MVEKLSIAEQLMYSTVRIETYDSNGQLSTGTGFFYRMFDGPETHVPLIVTNKHVVQGGAIGRMVFNIQSEDGQRIYNENEVISITDFESQWIYHPDPEVDLCVMTLARFINDAKGRGINLYYKTISEEHVPKNEHIHELDAIEEIIMIGYPNGIWDRVNNHPIIRRGITATHPAFKYNGKDEFLIDAAVFPGSSGSPVLTYNFGSYTDKDGVLYAGTRIRLIGILYAVHQHTAQGEVHVIEVPTREQSLALSKVPNNLGLVISSQKLRDFEDIIRPMLN